MEAAQRDKIADLKQLREGHMSMAKYYLSFKEPEQRERQQKEAARLRETAAKLLADAERIDTACADWKANYISEARRIEELAKEIVMLENTDKLARLEALMQQVKELNNE